MWTWMRVKEKERKKNIPGVDGGCDCVQTLTRCMKVQLVVDTDDSKEIRNKKKPYQSLGADVWVINVVVSGGVGVDASRFD